MEPQYAIDQDGKIVDMDIEDVFDHIFRQDYEDKLLYAAFWKLIEVYYPAFPALKAKFTNLPALQDMVINLATVQTVIKTLGIEATFLPTVNIDGADEQLQQWPEHTHAATIKIGSEDDDYTDFTFGVTPTHAMTLALVQWCRELSYYNLNRPKGYRLH